MKIELRDDGTVLNAYDDDSSVGDWYPDDTNIDHETEDGSQIGRGPLRVSRHQADDWPDRAARQWNDTTKRWESTGGQTGQTEIERVIRLLRNNPVPDLPASPTAAQVVQHVHILTQHTEAQRKIMIRLVRKAGRDIHRG